MGFLAFIPNLVKDVWCRPEPTFKEADYPDLSGQVWVVTGASGGIGYLVAKHLAEKNAKVWLVARSESKLKNTIEAILKDAPSAKLDFALVDFSDLKSVAPGLEKILKNEKGLHGVVHNAGVMHVPKGTVTEQGIESHLGVNDVAPQLVQDLLDPLLLKATSQPGVPAGRIVWVSSLAHQLSPTSADYFANPNSTKESPNTRYAFSKAINYIQAVQWAERHKGANVVSLAAHPGIIGTDLYRHNTGISAKISNSLTWPVEYGAYTELFAALKPGLKSGEYIEPFGRVGTIAPEIGKAAHDQRGTGIYDWINNKIQPFIPADLKSASK